MNPAIQRMLERYNPQTIDDSVLALREILQEVSLLGLWRAKFFENAAFYGGTALRIVYGLDRFSEDLDFTLLQPSNQFDIERYLEILEREVESYGFEVTVGKRKKTAESAVQSAFVKADTAKHLLTIQANEKIVAQIPRGQIITIRLEVDTDPPPNFETETRFLLQPIPFSVRVVALPDLFAGKMHAVLCRKWKTRVKGRDWYDLVWYIANHPHLHLDHLKERMVQSGHWNQKETLTKSKFRKLAIEAVDQLDVEQAKKEVEPFVKNPEWLEIWSRNFFREIFRKIEFV
jgi:predicted nucleotidyltransferase component of viral defense system